MDPTLQQAREHFIEGIAHFEAERFAAARACFETSLALAPGRASVLANLGITLSRLECWDEAIDALRRATAADAGQWDAWACLGVSHEALGQWPAAIDALGRALALEPGSVASWLALGRCRSRVASAASALVAFDRAVDLAPDLAQAWSERGSLLREMGRLDEAARCFEKAIALGADPELHAYYLASVRATARPGAPPRRYVEGLFDEYAGEFGSHLLAGLRYQAHATLVAPLLRAGRRYRAVLDLGCGTGLCGSLISPLADALDGVDVSGAMLAQARALGVYGELVHADLSSFLRETRRGADLVLAADVFIYVGELAGVFGSVRRILEPEGCFAFTVELAPEGADVALLPSLRYAHSREYILGLAQAHGFRVRDLLVAPLREDRRVPVQGLYAYLQ